MLALITSWMAGTWLRMILMRGKRLMPGDEHLVVQKVQQDLWLSEHAETPSTPQL